MNSGFTDLFIRRPVLAIVVSLLIFFVGLKSYTSLELRQFPRYEAAQISVSTGYPGASPSLMQGFIAHVAPASPHASQRCSSRGRS